MERNPIESFWLHLIFEINEIFEKDLKISIVFVLGILFVNFRKIRFILLFFYGIHFMCCIRCIPTKPNKIAIKTKSNNKETENLFYFTFFAFICNGKSIPERREKR